MDALWNIGLTAGFGFLIWWIKAHHEELKRVTILLNRTREEMAKEYVTKAEVHADINRVMDRLDALDAKLDRFLENRTVGK